MGNVGMMELLLVVVVALMVFGPDRLPELARQAGKMIARFRSETSRSIDELKRVADLDDLDRELRSIRSDLRDVRRNVGSAIVGPQGGPVRRDDDPPPLDPEAT